MVKSNTIDYETITRLIEGEELRKFEQTLWNKVASSEIAQKVLANEKVQQLKECVESGKVDKATIKKLLEGEYETLIEKAQVEYLSIEGLKQLLSDN